MHNINFCKNIPTSLQSELSNNNNKSLPLQIKKAHIQYLTETLHRIKKIV